MSNADYVLGPRRPLTQEQAEQQAEALMERAAAQHAEKVRPTDLTVWVVQQWIGGELSLTSIHASRESAKLYRHEGDTITAFGVWDVVRHSDGSDA